MNREIIEKAFDDALNDFISKCGRVSTRASVGNAFKRMSEKYGLSLKTYEVERSYRKKNDEWDDDYWHFKPVYTLYDKEHNTSLVFTERFLDENNIAYNSQGNHKNHTISLDELIEGYLKLPKNNKDSVNQVIFKHLSDKRIDFMGGVLAYSNFEDSSAKEMNTISMTSYYFNKENNYNPTGDDWDNYEFTLAHESTHCIDFRRVSDEEYNIRKKYLNIKQYAHGKKKILEDYNNLKKSETEKSNLSNGYPYYANYNYLKEKVGSEKANVLNKPSDYGRISDTEGFAETGAMIVTGFRNPDNPKAVVRWDGGTMQYREWVKLHPYFAQYLVKQIYDEDVSIDYLLGQSINTERNKLTN